MLVNRKAQTITELAVLGSLIIVAFAFLINYSEKINRQQAYLQQTFRLALKEAKNANNSASYNKVVFNRMPNVSNPMELGQVQSFSNSSNVLWADGKNRNPDGTPKDGVSKYQLNEASAIDVPITKSQNPPASGTTATSTNTFTNTVNTTTTFVKNETPGGIITTTKTLNATDTLDATVTVGTNPQTFTHKLGGGSLEEGGGGKYYPDNSKTLERTRSMQ
ncbi:MAG: hypothetical protein Q7K98_00275 [Candidatus Omnitrophota bacterium]|nr:hypothetical protein [Candidatus Omnitrophota bacterium]